MQQNSNNDQRNGLGIDVGSVRVGVAVANLSVRFARPLTTLQRPDYFYDDLLDICRHEDIALIVIGLPRGLNGQSTAQTEAAQAFGATLEQRLADAAMQIPVYWIDEALTSEKAQSELRSRGKGNASYSKPEVDALAATYILDDFLKEAH